MKGVGKNWESRRLSRGEIAIAEKVFGGQLECGRVRVMRCKFAFFQPKGVTMAPDGNVWLHPESALAMGPFADDFSAGPVHVRAHFVHELTHVWQYQSGVNLVLEKFLMWFRFGALGGYDYALEEGKFFSEYNIEQQASMVEHAYELRCCGGVPHLAERIFPFGFFSQDEVG